MSKSNEEDERYICTELNNNRRHYSALRFAMFTVYFAVIGGLASVAFGFVQAGEFEKINIGLWARVGGLLVTIVFFWFEILCTFNLKYFKEAAKRLPSRYTRVTRRKRFQSWDAHYATWGLYTLLIIFWICVLIRAA
jgi:hypothetical protein